MNKKTLMQIFLVFLIFFIFLIFYLKYLKDSPEALKDNLTDTKTNINQNISSTYINKIDYVSSDTKGNKYQITAEQAEINIKDPDVMFLTNVIAYIFIKNSDSIKIVSDFGEYNSKNYDTIFSKNVIVVYSNHKITGEYLDFSFLSNLITISTNVIYSGDTTNLFADKIEMNLTTKDTKIFMDDANKEVLVEGTK
jgi:LPS export ABC transporter protein LptC